MRPSRSSSSPSRTTRGESRKGRRAPPEAQCGCPAAAAPEELSRPALTGAAFPPSPTGQHLTSHPAAPPQLPASGWRRCRPGEDPPAAGAEQTRRVPRVARPLSGAAEGGDARLPAPLRPPRPRGPPAGPRLPSGPAFPLLRAGPLRNQPTFPSPASPEPSETCEPPAVPRGHRFPWR